MFGFSRDFLVILLHKFISILSSSESTLHAWIREGVRTLSPGEFKFLKFTRHVFRHFYCFQEKHILHAGNRGTWGSELLPGKIQICQVYSVKLPKKKSGSTHVSVLVYQEGKIFIPFFNLPKNQITCTCNNRRHIIYN